MYSRIASDRVCPETSSRNKRSTKKAFADGTSELSGCSFTIFSKKRCASGHAFFVYADQPSCQASPSIPEDWPSWRGPSSGKGRTSRSPSIGFRIEVARSDADAIEALGEGYGGTSPIVSEGNAIQAAIVYRNRRYSRRHRYTAIGHQQSSCPVHVQKKSQEIRRVIQRNSEPGWIASGLASTKLKGRQSFDWKAVATVGGFPDGIVDPHPCV